MDFPDNNGLVLIVDDTPANLDVLSETLYSANYDVAIATSGDRALKQVERRQPDLILLDINMPGMSGLDLCQKLKAHAKLSHIPVIFITAFTDIDHKLRGFEAGGVDFITKPFQTQEVLIRVKTHLQLGRLTQNLEAEVTRQLVSIEAAKQAAEQASLAKSQFLAVVSHELRTPLNVILGMVEGLQEEVFGPLTPRHRGAIEAVERSGYHLLDLINDILDVAKIEAGQLDLNLSLTAIAPLCHASFEFIQPQAQAKKLQLDLEVEPSLPDVILDERRIKQVLINLLSNAVKFTPERGRVSLRAFSVSTSPSTSKTLVFEVRDTGIGISPTDQARLFQPFVQVDTALNRQYQGTGLGLALVKHIVEKHGGQVVLESELGVGSCFSVQLSDYCLPTVVGS